MTHKNHPEASREVCGCVFRSPEPSSRNPICCCWMNRLPHWTGLFVTHNVAEAVFLSQRVLVMNKRPGTIIAEIKIPFPYPRKPELRADPDFARLCGELSQQLREAAR